MEPIHQESDSYIQTPDLVEYFDLLLDRYQTACERVGAAPVHALQIAGQSIHIGFAGAALEPFLLPALDHLVGSLCDLPDLTIYAWDSVSTGTPFPPLPMTGFAGVTGSGKEVGLFSPRGDYRGSNGGRVFIHLGQNLFSILDAGCGMAVYWCRDAAQIPLYEKGAPFRSILHWWLQRDGLQMIHAGAVGKVEGGVLLAGKGGTGKSTTALACLDSDLYYVSDDYCLVSTRPGAYGFSLYNTAKLRPDNLMRIPQLGGALINADRLENEKALFYIGRYAPEKLLPGLALRAILLPRVTGSSDTVVRPIDSHESLKAIALSTMRQLAGAGASTLQRIKALTDAIPSYRLELGTDLDQIAPIISRIIDSST